MASNGTIWRSSGALGPRNAFGRFFQVIAANRTHPAWWVESRAGDEAGDIEKVLGRGLWVLETIVTAAPLMGLLGTITGMMQSFKVIGGAGLVAPTQVTAGVAQALIATALGLLIALFALFAFNFFGGGSRARSTRWSVSRLVDRIRLDQETANTGCPTNPGNGGRRRCHEAPPGTLLRGRIEIIPMIDVMFFLLVTFMLASLSMQSLHSVPVDLPRGEAAAMQPQQPVTLTIAEDSQIYLERRRSLWRRWPRF